MTFRRVLSIAAKNYKAAIHVLFGHKYLFYTNVVLSMSIATLGDFLQQSYEIQNGELSKYELKRTVQMGCSGFTTGIISHNWYKFLDRVFQARTFGKVLIKVMLDQCISSPITIMSFFATVALFEDDPWENFTEEVQDKFWTLYTAELMVWPPAQIINFYYIPNKYRVLYDNTISLGYGIYTSRVKHEKKPDKEQILTRKEI